MPLNNPPLSLPITPSSPSLQSHIQALDLLSLQLSQLTSSTTHDVRIPLGTKASLKGEIIHTNDIKVNLGENKECFISMTAQEASEYVKRRKEGLLEEHARLLEGKDRFEKIDQGKLEGKEVKKGEQKGGRPKIGLHPLFYKTQNAVAGPSKLQNEEIDTVTSTQKGKEKEKPDSEIQDTTMKVGEAAKVDAPQAKNTTPISAKSTAQSKISVPEKPEPAKASLVELLDDDDDDDEEEGEASNPLGGDDTTLNEEGLPIHEIRETLSGETIGRPPPPSTTTFAESSKNTVNDGEDDYFSAEAVARRAALRRRLFNEDTSSDEEDESVLPTSAGPIKAKGGIIRSTPSTNPESSPVEESNKSTKSSTPPNPTNTLNPPSSHSPPVRERRPSSTQPLPSKSILKPPKPIERKKSVSFDPSIPSPPTSPAPSSLNSQISNSNRFGFPLPLAVDQDDTSEFEQRPVPIIPTPQPKKKDDGLFGGFKRGFLDKTPRVQPAASSTKDQPSSSTNQISKVEKAKLTAVKDIVSEKPVSSRSSIASNNSITPTVPEDKPKKQSLFSQRLSHHEIDASAPNIHTTPSSIKPNLPKVSESKATNTVKSGVVEKAPVAVQSGVKERTGPSDNLRIIERPLPSVNDTSQSKSDSESGTKYHENFSSDEDEFSEYSTGSEDEYDLDQALLAREVALEYHKRQTYKALNRDLDDPHQDEEEEGGVILGLPSISTPSNSNSNDPYNKTGAPMIINPTPDDLRRFIRIGKLENGNLVLAPGEESLETDDEDDQEGEEGEEEKERRKERKENRENIRKTLMGLEVPQIIEREKKEKEEIKKRKGKEKQVQDWENSLPPTLGSVNDRDEEQSDRDPEDSGSKTDMVKERSSIESQPQTKSKLPILPLVPESESASPTQVRLPNTSTSVFASPPTPASATASAPASSRTANQPESEKPKKVSRFKAARMAGNQ